MCDQPYMPRLMKALGSFKVNEKAQWNVQISHDDWCKVFEDDAELCTCQPDIRITNGMLTVTVDEDGEWQPMDGRIQ